MIKMIAIDLDGTLLTDDKIFTENTKEIIRKVAEMGIYVIIATGRPYKAASVYDEKLNINHPILAQNGAIVKEMTGELTLFKPIPIKKGIDLVDYCQKRQYTCSIFLDDSDVYINKPDCFGRKIHLNLNNTNPKICRDLKKMITKPLLKILITDENPEKINEINLDLVDKFGQVLNVAQSGSWYIDIMEKGVTKGAALKYIAEKLGISSEYIMAIGDSRNDLEMLEFAKIPIAMGNADDIIKQKSNYITKSNNDDGVFETIKKFILEKGGRE